jgi:hypothetical protein
MEPIINPDGPNGSQPSNHNTPKPPANSGGWDYYDPWVWTSWFPMIEPSASGIPWMVATGNHDTELFSTSVAAGLPTVENYDPHGYGGLVKRMDLPGNGPSACPSVYSFRYGNVGIISLDANDLSWEIQGLFGDQQRDVKQAGSGGLPGRAGFHLRGYRRDHLCGGGDGRHARLRVVRADREQP